MKYNSGRIGRAMRIGRSGTVGVALLALASAAMAQAIYRNVDASGKVTFSDQPPAASALAAPARGGAGTASSGAINAALGYELRQIVQRYPVTIYTSEECGPCATGRAMLSTRGIPFDERTVKTPQDADALQRLSGQNSLPLLSIGSQQLKGYSDVEWSQYLDAAGYPKSVQLPAGYRNAPAQPLVAAQTAPAAAPPPAQAARTSSPAPALPAAPTSAGPTADNPAGIKF